MNRIVIALLLIVPLMAYAMNATNGKVTRPQSETSPTVYPSASVTYDRDCNGNGKPRGMKSTITTVASGVGSVVTVQELDATSGVPGTNVYTTTIDSSASGVVATSCASWVQQ